MKNCITCGKRFTIRSRSQRYCSVGCRPSAQPTYKKETYLASRKHPRQPRGAKPDLEKRAASVATATALRAEGHSLSAIGERMGLTRQRVHQLLTWGR